MIVARHSSTVSARSPKTPFHDCPGLCQLSIGLPVSGFVGRLCRSKLKTPGEISLSILPLLWPSSSWMAFFAKWKGPLHFFKSSASAGLTNRDAGVASALMASRFEKTMFFAPYVSRMSPSLLPERDQLADEDMERVACSHSASCIRPRLCCCKTPKLTVDSQRWISAWSPHRDTNRGQS